MSPTKFCKKEGSIMRRVVIAIAVLVLLMVGVALYGQKWARRSDGLQIQLSTNRERYEHGEPVEITFKLYNDTDKRLTYKSATGSLYDVWITTTTGKEVWRYTKANPSTIRNREIKIDPGKTEVIRIVWPQTDTKGTRQSPGWYVVYARFMMDHSDKILNTRIRIEEEQISRSSVIYVPYKAGQINPNSDVGKDITIEGTLFKGSQGLYVDVKRIRVSR